METIPEILQVENTLRSHWAYQKISKKPDEFTDYEREEAFSQYVRSLEKNTFHFTFKDMKNFEDWHTKEYTVTCRYVYIFLDKENDRGADGYFDCPDTGEEKPIKWGDL